MGKCNVHFFSINHIYIASYYTKIPYLENMIKSVSPVCHVNRTSTQLLLRQVKKQLTCIQSLLNVLLKKFAVNYRYSNFEGFESFNCHQIFHWDTLHRWIEIKPKIKLLKSVANYHQQNTRPLQVTMHTAVSHCHIYRCKLSFDCPGQVSCFVYPQ